MMMTRCNSFDCCSTGNAEEHATLSRALSQLAEVEEKIEQLHIQQVTTVINLYFSTCISQLSTLNFSCRYPWSVLKDSFQIFCNFFHFLFYFNNVSLGEFDVYSRFFF